MADELMDVKIAKTGRVYERVPLEKLRRWITERRILPTDSVRPVGARNWLRVSMAPELAGNRPSGPAATRRANPTDTDTDLGIDAPAKSRPRRRKFSIEDTTIDLTPMIDVVFQLLIFFMFSNQMANPNPIEVPEAQYGRGIMPDGKQSIVIDAEGQYYLGESTKPENVSPSLDTLVQEVANNAALAEGPLDVIISAHKKSIHLQVRGLVEQLDKIENVGAVHLGVEERQ